MSFLTFPDYIKSSKTYLSFSEQSDNLSHKDFDGIDPQFLNFSLLDELLLNNHNPYESYRKNKNTIFISLIKLFDYWDVVDIPFKFLDEIYEYGFCFREYFAPFLRYTKKEISKSFMDNEEPVKDYIFYHLVKIGFYIKLLEIFSHSIEELANYAILHKDENLLTYVKLRLEQKLITPSYLKEYDIKYIMIKKIFNEELCIKEMNFSFIESQENRFYYGLIYCGDKDKKLYENFIYSIDSVINSHKVNKYNFIYKKFEAGGFDLKSRIDNVIFLFRDFLKQHKVVFESFENIKYDPKDKILFLFC